MSADSAIELFFYGFLAAVAAIALYFPTFAWLHYQLPQRLDAQLFRAPFFSRAEQTNYRFFPLNMVKTISYIQLIAVPGWARRRRFRDLSSDVAVDYSTSILSKINFWLSVAIALYGVVYFLGGGLLIYIYG